MIPIDSLIFCSVLNMTLLWTNPYTKEYISLDKGDKQDFQPETCFDLIPGNIDHFSAELEKYSGKFGYRSLLNVPTNCNVNATNASEIIYKDNVNVIDTWNKISDDLIAKSVNEVWGTCDWTVSTTKQTKEMTAKRGKIETASAITRIGKHNVMERWKSTILAHQLCYY
jgi:hypothetical protein